MSIDIILWYYHRECTNIKTNRNNTDMNATKYNESITDEDQISTVPLFEKRVRTMRNPPRMSISSSNTMHQLTSGGIENTLDSFRQRDLIERHTSFNKFKSRSSIVKMKPMNLKKPKKLRLIKKLKRTKGFKIILKQI